MLGPPRNGQPISFARPGLLTGPFSNALQEDIGMTRYCTPACLIAAALTLGLVGSDFCYGQEAAKPKQRRKAVVVVNVGRLYKESQQFKAEMEKMKAEVAKTEESVRRQRDEITSQREEMEKLPATSDQRLKKGEHLSKAEATMATSIGSRKKAFLKREAAIYLDLYKRIEAEIGAYVKENKVDLVIRTSDETLDTSKPDSVLQHINRPVIFASADTDITSIIAERIASHKDLPEEGDESGDGQ
jgi:Skp family chaperone for outer membrane proteins